MSLVVLRVPPRGLLQRTPALGWSSMNSPYCCLMEMGTQTNEQPLPGSAPRVLINPDAETLMALIFQTKRCLRLTAPRHSPLETRESFNQGHSPQAERWRCSCHTWSVALAPSLLDHLPPPAVPICVCWEKHKVMQARSESRHQRDAEEKTRVQITFEGKRLQDAALIFRDAFLQFRLKSNRNVRRSGGERQ